MYKAAIKTKKQKPLSVLVVEDEPAAREASCRYLSLQGCDVSAASTAAEAKDEADRHRPDVVVCDWHLGDGPTGSELARDLQLRLGAIPFIFVSAHPTDEVRLSSDGVKRTMFLRKPVSLAALYQHIVAAV
ncbi:MAG: response regulator [Pseudomonadota bacterium]